MSRKSSNDRASFSPTQRKACIVLVGCVLAVVATFLLSWVLPEKLGWGSAKTGYDPALYPVDTTLGAVLTQTAEAGGDYLSGTVFVGDQYTQSLQTLNQIVLNQYVGASGLSVSDVIRNACVFFQDDAASYTIPQALARMKPRRIIVTLGSNDVDGSKTLDAFLQDYKQALSAITSAYPYCDVIVNSIPPLAKSAQDAATRQLRIDQFNQALAALCDSEGYKFLNTAETLKTSTGFAEEAYLDATATAFNNAGAATFLAYARSHAYVTEDRRPDTNDIPQRAAQAAADSATVTPSPTPLAYTVSYRVEEGKGTLTGNSQSGVATLEFQAADRSSVSVTAVAAEGYTFYKWSDGQTDATRYDVVTQDLSVTAMFNDARVDLTLDRGDTTMNMGESISINATVKLGGKDYDNSSVQWSVNEELEANTGTFTFTPGAAGTYIIKAGLEINGTYASKMLTVTVNAPATTLVITGPGAMPAGSSTTLTASGQNITGDVVWSCDQQPGWSATGAQVQFTAQTAGSYLITATNNGVSVQYTLTVTDVVPPTQPPATDAPWDSSGILF